MKIVLLVLIVSFIFMGCGLSGESIKKCEKICTLHGGVKYMQPNLNMDVCFCKEDNVRSNIYKITE